MKFLTFTLFSLIIFTSVSFGQSYWFGGMTRIPGGETDGIASAFNIGGQSFSQDVKSAHLINTGNLVPTTIPLDDDQDTFLEYKTFQIGAEAAWLSRFFEVEGGLDLSLSGAYTDHPDFDDELFLGINFRLGGVFKYDFEPADHLIVTPYFRTGLSLEFVTNDLATPSYYTYNPYGYDTSSYYNDFYGTSLMNFFYNFRVGSSLRWHSFKSSLALGKYFPIGGDISDFYDNTVYNAPDPLFLQLNIGYEFSSSLSMSLGWRLEWWDDSISYPFGNDIIKEEVEWNGSALDLTFDKRF